MIGKAIFFCEESQEVCKAFRAQGWEAYSNDILPCSGGRPEWHIQADARTLLNEKIDLFIAFPDCTFLTVSNTYIGRGCSKYTPAEALVYRQNAIDFFMLFANHPCKLKAIENPIGVMSTLYRKADQIIQPNEYGHDASKKTCLWLTGLPALTGTEYIPPRIVNGRKIWGNQTPTGQNKLGPSADRAKLRAKTYPGIAKAMATQWTEFYIKNVIGI